MFLFILCSAKFFVFISGGHMHVKFILPALTEATSPYWRPIKYSLFPPLGLATLAAYLDPNDEAWIVDEHVEPLSLEDEPDLVVIQVYITNAYRAYAIADQYRSKGCYVVLGGLHVTALPDEAAPHADSLFLGPGEETFPQFLKDFFEPAWDVVIRARQLRHMWPVLEAVLSTMRRPGPAAPATPPGDPL
jgi:radical SAM superfamily enzyme YgiQ (UPF0313 family)